MSPADLECVTCEKSLDACICPDIDERLHTYLCGLETIAKHSSKEQRQKHNLEVNRFRPKPELVLRKSESATWAGLRDAFFYQLAQKAKKINDA